MGSKGGGKGGGRRKRGKGAGNRSTPKRSPQGDDAGADTSPGSTASPSGKSPATNRRKVDDVDPLTMEVEALDDGTEAAAAKAAEEAAQRLEAESQNVTPDETEKNAKAKGPTPPTDQEQDGQDGAEDEETPRSPPQRQKSFAKAAAFSDSDSDDDEVLDLAVDATILPAISTLSTNQTSPTERTNDDIKQLLDYLATHPDAVIRYHASDMILYVHSDASYLSEPKARSRLGGHFYLSARQQDPFKTPNPTDPIPPNNGAIKNNSTIMKCVLASAAEAEYGAVFFNMGDAVPIRKTLEEMGHPQPPTHIITDNSTAVGLANKTVKQRRSKAVDMRFYWVQDRVLQKQFLVYWRKGADNLADYMTKHFPARYHIIVQRPNYLNVEDE